MSKPEAAYLMDWFYALPPYQWLLPDWRIRTTLPKKQAQPKYPPMGW